MSTFSPNIQYEEVARGGDVGTWDTPTNSNWTITDLALGGIATIPLNNSNIILSAAQFQSNNITFVSTLTGSVTITFPTSFAKGYEIYNACTGSSAFTITLETTAVGSVICAPPGEIVDVRNYTGNMFYKNLPPIGSYWDYAGSSVPNWVSGCTTPPWLNCDGTSFSSATFPYLATILGGTTLPDSRGRARFALDQSAGRISSAAGGFSGSSVGAAGGSQTTTLSSQNVPPVPITDPGHSHTLGGGSGNQGLQSGTGGPVNIGGSGSGGSNVNIAVLAAVTGISAGSASPTAFTNLPPAFISGLMLIRAG